MTRPSCWDTWIMNTYVINNFEILDSQYIPRPSPWYFSLFFSLLYKLLTITEGCRFVESICCITLILSVQIGWLKYPSDLWERQRFPVCYVDCRDKFFVTEFPPCVSKSNKIDLLARFLDHEYVLISMLSISLRKDTVKVIISLHILLINKM
jgi:hypothetical protein